MRTHSLLKKPVKRLSLHQRKNRKSLVAACSSELVHRRKLNHHLLIIVSILALKDLPLPVASPVDPVVARAAVEAVVPAQAEATKTSK